ncbi:hypothetical protein [Argonema antarcticum]|uniref:hypothetical protein n=1 Tax=Argonema antarcticum TaxID=2942763 RepID=UPI002011A1FF|nr:hypothetical protein [Argonema antarcticum]MCL1474324.1 hypothetical protein [Argonema antarcticum A004/B2]
MYNCIYKCNKGQDWQVNPKQMESIGLHGHLYSICSKQHTMKTRKTRKPRPKGQSLTAASKIHPETWNISKEEAAKALKAFGIPVKEIKKVTCLKHQVCISYQNQAGFGCCSFFSYRIFARWQQAVEKLIADSHTISEWESLGDIIEYDLVKFPYPRQIANALWDALKHRWHQLIGVAKYIKI